MSLEQLDPDERLRLVRFVCSFAWADLEVVDAERKVILELVRQLELDDEEQRQVDEWLRYPPVADALDPQDIPREHRALFLAAAKQMVAADGAISEDERESYALLEALLA